jgi:hypothetical protein
VKRLAALAVVLALAGCGGRHGDRIPSSLAHPWALRADRVAVTLRGGDGCTARRLATSLQHQVVAAVNAHRIPPSLLERLASDVNEVYARIGCGGSSDDAAATASAFADWLRSVSS